MPALILEQFYMPILFLNTLGHDLALETARNLKLHVGPWAKTRNLRVSGQIDTAGNIHAVWALEPLLYPPLLKIHPVKFEGDPHIHMAVVWLLATEQPAKWPWEDFNDANNDAYTLKQGVVHLRDLHHRTSLMQRLKSWTRLHHPDCKYPDEVPGVWVDEEQVHQIDGRIIMRPGQMIILDEGGKLVQS
jgi:hypothetical protein